MDSIKEVLMTRDGLSEVEAELVIAEARVQLDEYLAEGDMEGAENICEEFFGLEPDYIMELM